jgi:rare lipoprotein A
MADTRSSMLPTATLGETRGLTRAHSHRFRWDRAHLYLLGGLCVLFSVGCASRHPVVGQPPALPTPTPESTAESAKRSTSVPETATANPAAKSPRRGKTPTPPAAIGYSEEGNASWYGAPFHGRRSSNGEVYDMNKMTAAHRTLPFDTIVRVTNTNNGKTAVVRITDRGPFVENRILDLSYAAAQEIAAVGPGVIPVRLEVISSRVDITAGFFTVQVGAFRDHSNAERLRERLNAAYGPVVIHTFETPDGPFYRVHAGRIAGEEAARESAEQLHTREGLATFVLRLDESPSAATPQSDTGKIPSTLPQE